MIFLNHQNPELEIMLDENAFTPVRAHKPDAGMDILSPVDKVVPAHGSAVIDTGVHVNLPAIQIGDLTLYTAGLLKSKSGLNVKNNLTGEGVVDVDYTGSIQVKLYNNGDKDYHIKRKDKIIQLLVVPVLTPDPKVVDQFTGVNPEGRGDGGFGSTGR